MERWGGGANDDLTLRLQRPGADYGLGTIGMCLGPPPARGPPSDQKKKKKINEKKHGRENYKNGSIAGYIILFVNYI